MTDLEIQNASDHDLLVELVTVSNEIRADVKDVRVTVKDQGERLTILETSHALMTGQDTNPHQPATPVLPRKQVLTAAAGGGGIVALLLIIAEIILNLVSKGKLP